MGLAIGASESDAMGPLLAEAKFRQLVDADGLSPFEEMFRNLFAFKWNELLFLTLGWSELFLGLAFFEVGDCGLVSMDSRLRLSSPSFKLVILSVLADITRVIGSRIGSTLEGRMLLLLCCSWFLPFMITLLILLLACSFAYMGSIAPMVRCRIGVEVEVSMTMKILSAKLDQFDLQYEEDR